MKKRLPVTVFTGFLGSGKTTILRQLLIHGNQRLAVMVNEFGSVGLDGDLIRSCNFCSEDEVDSRIVELNNGCLCCTVQEDFLPTMNKLLLRSDSLDGIIVETSGLALPRPLLQALDWPEVRSRVFVNALVTVVDGEAMSLGSPIGDISILEKQRSEDPNIDHLSSVEELFEDQLKFADLVLLSRADLIGSDDIQRIKDNISSFLPSGTQIIPTSNGHISPDLILNVNRSSDDQLNEGLVSNHNHEDHSHVKIFSSSIQLEGKVDREKIESLLKNMALEYQVVRMKGRLWLEGKELPLQLQMVGPRLCSWYEEVPKKVWQPIAKTGGMDLVVLSFQENAYNGIKRDLEQAITE